MQIQQIHTVCPQLLQAQLHALGHLVRHVITRIGRVLDLGGEGQAALLPSDLAREGLLLDANVDSRRVAFVVAALLEDVKDLTKFVDRGDACA